jgi:hypothetical protein
LSSALRVIGYDMISEKTEALLFGLSAPRKNPTTPRQIFLTGLFWLIISIPLAVVLRLFAGIVFLLGLIFVYAGYVGNQNMKKNLRKEIPMGYPSAPPYPQQIIIQAPPTQASTSTHSEVTREIVKVRCRSCNSLNFETSARCFNCGASL